jgi:acid phosphatase
VVVFENKDYAAISSSPTFAAWAKEGALLTDSHGVTHPSEPNYLALWSGGTQGVTDDSCQDVTANNLGEQLITLGYSVRGFLDAMPTAGYTGCTYGTGQHVYARKHNPLVDFAATAGAGHNVPFTQWPSDYSRLPTVSLVVPDLCNDMHDCTVATGDAWLRTELGDYKAWAGRHNSLLVVTFDEDSAETSANRIYTFLLGEHVSPGATYSSRVTHVNVLHTIEQAYGLPQLGSAAAPITGIYR